MSLVKHLAEKYGLSATMVRALCRDLIEGFHREAFMEGSTGAVMQARWEFGDETCFHLWGLFMESYTPHRRTGTNLDDTARDWEEFLMRFDHRVCLYGRTMEMWRYDRDQEELNEKDGHVYWRDDVRVQKLLTEEIPAKVASDEAYQHAMHNAGKQNARVAFDDALRRVIVQLVEDDTKLFRRFSEDGDFKHRLADKVFGMTYEPKPAV